MKHARPEQGMHRNGDRGTRSDRQYRRSKPGDGNKGKFYGSISGFRNQETLENVDVMYPTDKVGDERQDGGRVKRPVNREREIFILRINKKKEIL